MIAVVEIAGFQEMLEKGMKLRVPTLVQNEGESVTFDKVLFLSENGSDAVVGTPHIQGATVIAKVLNHGKSDKILVRKFKRRKRYFKTLRGHRQAYTEIEITGIGK